METPKRIAEVAIQRRDGVQLSKNQHQMSPFQGSSESFCSSRPTDFLRTLWVILSFLNKSNQGCYKIKIWKIFAGLRLVKILKIWYLWSRKHVIALFRFGTLKFKTLQKLQLFFVSVISFAPAKLTKMLRVFSVFDTAQRFGKKFESSQCQFTMFNYLW